jgi:hypothetical protein
MDADKPVVGDTKTDPPRSVPEQKRLASRHAVTCDALQSVIAEAVKTSGPKCEAFVGVWLEKRTPNSRDDANWKVKGVKYGKSDRVACDAALFNIIEQLQQEFVILD